MSAAADVPLIAVVDDEKPVRVALDSFLRSVGYRSVMFESGEAFLDSNIKEEISCLILDLEMPGLNGLEVQRQLVQMNCLIPPTIFFSGNDSELREQALKLGGFAVLNKTCRSEDLISAIATALG